MHFICYLIRYDKAKNDFKGENDERFLTNYCNCLEKLTEKQYEILYLRYVNELSLKEIAKILSIKENTAKQRLFSAKQKFRDLIMEDMNYEQ